jgi:hypothetical protein
MMCESHFQEHCLTFFISTFEHIKPEPEDKEETSAALKVLHQRKVN